MDIISFHKTYGKYGLEVETIPTATFHRSGVLEYKNLFLIQENKYKIFLFSTRWKQVDIVQISWDTVVWSL